MHIFIILLLKHIIMLNRFTRINQDVKHQSFQQVMVISQVNT